MGERNRLQLRKANLEYTEEKLVIYAFVCFSFLSPKRRSEVVLEEKPESSLVKNVSFAGHVSKKEVHSDTPLDGLQQGQH